MKLGVKLNFRTIAYEYGVLRSRSENMWLFIFGKMVIVPKKWPRLFRTYSSAIVRKLNYTGRTIISLNFWKH